MLVFRARVGSAFHLLAAMLGCVACSFDNSGADGDDDVDADVDGSPDAGPRVSDEVLDGLAAATLADENDALEWAKQTSAPMVLVIAYAPISEADLLRESGHEVCPRMVEAGDTRTYTGECVTSANESWFGTATVVGPLVNGVPALVTYDHFGHDGTTMCNTVAFYTERRYTGTVRRGATLPALPVNVDLVIGQKRPSSACTIELARYGYDYDLTLVSGPDANLDNTPDTRTWNGSGRIGKDMGEHAGMVTAQTANEVTAQQCGAEALSGKTTLSAGAHQLVIGYDGAATCDPESTVTWSLDGVAKGELKGVVCTVGAPGGRAKAPPLLLVLLLLLGSRRRWRTAR
jgi:hypothetical protein